MTSNSSRASAQQAVAELVANGAAFHFRPALGALPASFTYELPGHGDRRRCRQIIAEAKANPMVWAAMLREIASRSKEAA